MTVFTAVLFLSASILINLCVAALAHEHGWDQRVLDAMRDEMSEEMTQVLHVVREWWGKM